MTVKGKTVVVTGAASGMGKAVAEYSMEQGARVIGLDISKISLPLDQGLSIDLSDELAIDRAVQQIDEPIDMLFNVAGVSLLPPPSMVLKINFLGHRRFTEQLLTRMNNSARVLSMASVAAYEWQQNLGRVKACLALSSFDQVEKYCADWKVDPSFSYKLSKECLIAWNQQMAARYPDNSICFNTVSPGPVDTQLWHEAHAASGKRGEKFVALSPRIPEPPEIAHLFIMLCRDEMTWFNGANLAIDGGLAARLNCERFGLV